MAGLLSVVATPIGNLEDLSERARSTFAAADVIACEDTRRTGGLLSHLGLSKRLVSLHEHNERQRLPRLLDLLADGRHIVLVSDAGTPLLSDPGYRLVAAAIAHGHRVTPIPGPSAVLAALVASGLAPQPFTFCGFPPPKQGKRRTFYRRFAELDHTLVIFESPHRLAASLEDAAATLGSERAAALTRELTKLHEEVVRSSLGGLARLIAERGVPRGEMVLVVGPPGKPTKDEEAPAERIG
jgi:16S rRNA (cytidine1402-2'-O)-methyltransferase